MTSEPVWLAETVPASIAAVGAAVRSAWQLPVDAIGAKGDANHRYGYHRSRRWVLHSPYSRYGSGDYSVTHAEDRAGGDDNWVCALDVTPGRADLMIAACKRIDAALRAGALPNVREFFGNVDGNQVVDGWDALLHRATTSDSSHLWHFHVSFLRSRAGHDHSDLLGVILGTSTTMEDDMQLSDPVPGTETADHPAPRTYGQVLADLWQSLLSGRGLWQASGVDAALQARDAVKALTAQLGSAAPAGLTDAQVSALAEQLAPLLARPVAELRAALGTALAGAGAALS